MDSSMVMSIAKMVINEMTNIAKDNIKSVNINSTDIISEPIAKKFWVGSYCIDIKIK